MPRLVDTWHCAQPQRAPDTLVSLCFVDDFTRVGHLRAISRTMVALPSTEDSIAISSHAGDRSVVD